MGAATLFIRDGHLEGFGDELVLEKGPLAPLAESQCPTPDALTPWRLAAALCDMPASTSATIFSQTARSRACAIAASGGELRRCKGSRTVKSELACSLSRIQ